MRNQFEIMFSILLSHDYFDSEERNGLSIEPDYLTSEIFYKYGFIGQSFNNQFDLFSKTTPDIVSQLEYIKRVTRKDYFRFNLTTSCSNFNLYTELPSKWNGVIQYCNKTTDSSNNKLVLSPFYNETIADEKIGEIKIYFDEFIRQKKENLSYEIVFQSRRTQWNYYIINRSSIPINAPFIQAQNANQFIGPENVTLLTGENALLFTSGENLIPLKSVTNDKYDLADSTNHYLLPNTQKKTKVIYRGLPIAGPSNTTSIKGVNTSAYASSMYIYI